MKTGLITTNNYHKHNTGNGHPEKIDRVTSVIDNFKKKNNKNLIWQEPKKFDQYLLIKTHSKDYFEFVNNYFPKEGFSIITAIDGVESREYKNAFCAVRPPGHHAEKNKAMGFCIYNNVAVGANYLIEKYNYKKLAIIDFDVHHGNGTQDIFYENEKVLYLSTHQYPYYPGTGTEQEKGKYNNIFNIPLEAGTTSENYLTAYDYVLNKISEFKPQFLLFSAGFDAHKDDPLAQLKLNSEDFYTLTKRTLEATRKFCDGKVVSILEGGYDLNALMSSTEKHVDALIEFN